MIIDNGLYYIYRHIRPDKGVPFYIGIGSKRERYSRFDTEYTRAFSKKGRCKIWWDIVNKNNGIYDVEILVESNDYKFLEKKEDEFIQLYGKLKDKCNGLLANIADGGNTSKGIPCPNRYICAKQVFVYNAETGKFIGSELSTTDAAKRYNTDPGAVRSCLSGKVKTSNRHYFSYTYKGEYISSIIIRPQERLPFYASGKATIKLDKLGNVLEEQPYLREYERLYNYKSPVIVTCIQNGTSAYGYYWRYKSDIYPIPEKVYVYKYNKDSITVIDKYETVHQAAVSNNMRDSNISAAILGRLKTCGGYIWKRY